MAARARAQQKPMPVIGYLSGIARALSPNVWSRFHGGLGETGFAEGRNVAIEYRWAEGNYDRLPELAAELVARNVDIIAATGGPRSATGRQRCDLDDPDRLYHRD